LDLIRHAESIFEQLEFLKSLEQDIKSNIANRLDGIKTRGLSALPLQKSKDLLKWVQNKTKELNQQFNDELRQPLKDIADYEVSYQKNITQSTISDNIPDQVTFNFELINPPQTLISAIVSSNPLGGRLMTEYTSKWSTNLRDNLSAEVRLGLVQGQTTNDILKRLEPVLATSKAGARAIVHTTVSGVANSARDLMYSANPDMIKGLQWVATLDSRTTEICRGLDGQVFPLNSGPRPPAHFACRSTMVPVTKSWKELGIDLNELPIGERPTVRDGLAGNIAANKTYSDWLSSQDAAFQREILGDKKYELFAKGDLTLDKFVSFDTLKPLTLDEIRAREPAAWKRAGL
jgi:SPP1 gp7 family putative phage head morphogenesis protein